MNGFTVNLMFTVSAVVLTIVKSFDPVFQSIGAEKQHSLSVDSGQLSDSG